MKFQISIITILLLIFSSCTKDENTKSINSFEKGGIFIINEGNYSVGNSSMTYYNPEKDTIIDNIFAKANIAPLGDVAQSIIFHNDLAFITVNNSGYIYAINCNDASFAGKIDNLISPRNILIINDQKAYISDLYSPNITIVNPLSYKTTGHINIGKSSESMVKLDNKIFVSNWSNYNQTALNNTIMIIDSETDELLDSITVGIEPESIVIDNNNSLWILCSGGFMNDENPTLWKININTFNVETKFTFSNIQNNPTNLKINESLDRIYFLNDGVYTMSVDDTELPTNPLIENGSNNFYSLGVADNGDIYVSDVLDYNRDGKIYRYDNNGQLITSFDAGIIPGDFGFY